MPEREATALSPYFPKESVRARAAGTSADQRPRGAAVQLAAVHRTLRHGPLLPLRADDSGSASVVQRKVGFELEQSNKRPLEEEEARSQGQNRAVNPYANAPGGGEIEFVSAPLPDSAEAIEAVEEEKRLGPVPVNAQGKPDGKP
jgi:hypothetical protein